MEIKEERHSSYVTLSPQGDLDANSSVDLDERIQAMLESGDRFFHIDGTGIQYISSAGLGVFVSHLEDIKQAGGKLVLSSLSESVTDVFALLGLDQLLTITASQEDAEQYLTQS